jgi:hypothetical protein
VLICSIYAIAAEAQTAKYSEGWYQIKRTIGVSDVANVDVSNLSGLNLSSLLAEVSYLNTGDELTANITVPVVNISAGTAVYGARLLAVNGTSDYTNDLTASNGRNANEKELSTYFYITPVGADDDGDWRYTIRSVNGHYMGTNGRYYAEPKEVYINTSLGISIDESTDVLINTMTSLLGTSIGSKQITLSTSYIDDIPYIDRLDIYEQLKQVIDSLSLSDASIKVSEYTWTKKTVVDAATGDSIQCIGSTNILDVLSAMAQNSEQIIAYYNDGDYESIARMLLQHLGLDLFKIKKINLDNVATTSGMFAKHIKVTPYTVNLIGFGDNFSLEGVDYSTTDALTRLSQKTNQNAMVAYSGTVANESTLTKVYNGGTLFLTSGTTIGDASLLTLSNDNGTDVVDLSHAQHYTVIDNDAHTIDIIASSPKKSSILSQWSDNYKTVRINSAGYATLYTPFELTIPSDEKTLLGSISKNAPKAYVAYKRDYSNVYFSEITDRIPANTAFLIKGDANRSYNFTVVDADNASASPISNSLLLGKYASYDVPDGVNAYVLSTANTPVFALLNGESATVDAWQAYFTADSANAPETYNIVFDEANSAITTIAVDAAEGETVIYDITGRRVQHTTTLAPGIYIINGVKTLVR